MEAQPTPHRNGTVPVMTLPQNKKGNLAAAEQPSQRPTIADLQGDNHFAQLARKTWLGKKKAPKVNAKVVKEELWDHLEQDGFKYSDLLILETLQAVEKYGPMIAMHEYDADLLIQVPLAWLLRRIVKLPCPPSRNPC